PRGAPAAQKLPTPRRWALLHRTRHVWPPPMSASCPAPATTETIPLVEQQLPAAAPDDGSPWGRVREVTMAANGGNGARAAGPRCAALGGPFQSGQTTLLEGSPRRTRTDTRPGTSEARKTQRGARRE